MVQFIGGVAEFTLRDIEELTIDGFLTNHSSIPLFLSYLHRLLKVGVPKTFDESKKSDLRYIRKAGVHQFISTYNRVKDLKGEELLWGDEIEYGIFHIDPESKKVRLSLRAKEVSPRVRMCHLSHR
jgi:hypothetical protein